MTVTLIEAPAGIPAAGDRLKRIEEFFGAVRSRCDTLSLARMKSPGGWSEPGQTPDFDEYTLVLKGHLRVKTRTGALDVKAGQAVLVTRGEWVQYSTPAAEGADYVAVCVPAFTPARAHRDPEPAPPVDPPGAGRDAANP